MIQRECSDCGAPLREDGRCPWASARGCGRRLRITEKQVAAYVERVRHADLPPAPPTPKPYRRHHAEPVGNRNRDPNRTTCETGRHPRPLKGRCLDCKRQALRDLRARRRGSAAA